MKKLAGILSAVLLLTTLSGCYKADTTFDFGLNGGVEVASTILADKSTFEAAGLSALDDLMETFSPETIEMYSAMYGMPELGERIAMTRVDAAGNELAAGTPFPEDGSMVGACLEMRYDSLSDATGSFTLLNFLRAVPLSQDANGNGLNLEEKHTLFGTKYEASGKISLYGSELYKAEFDAASAEEQAKIATAENSISFKFPLAFSKSNADSKGFLGSELTWTVANDAPEKEVYFSVMVLNPVILAMGILILLLLIYILILKLGQKKNEPEAYFVDAEGNPIPVYDEILSSEDEAFEAEDEVAEIIEEIPAEETEPEADSE